MLSSSVDIQQLRTGDGGGRVSTTLRLYTGLPQKLPTVKTGDVPLRYLREVNQESNLTGVNGEIYKRHRNIRLLDLCIGPFSLTNAVSPFAT